MTNQPQWEVDFDKKFPHKQDSGGFQWLGDDGQDSHYPVPSWIKDFIRHQIELAEARGSKKGKSTAISWVSKVLADKYPQIAHHILEEFQIEKYNPN